MILARTGRWTVANQKTTALSAIGVAQHHRVEESLDLTRIAARSPHLEILVTCAPDHERLIDLERDCAGHRGFDSLPIQPAALPRTFHVLTRGGE